MSNFKILLAVLALTAVPVANVAAQQVIMMPLQSQEVRMVNVTGDSNFCNPGTCTNKKIEQGRIPTSPTQPPAPSIPSHRPASIYY
ncbi:hypothetical protein FS594_16590 [Rahnella aquatilis]|jgi:multiple stress resistance protein BhsA|uniref:Periplasmic protein n=1 Tax=Rahnella perminowiae TaxID=2816244 RepID=A0ABS6L7D5_9GAMM|nr:MULTISPECIES: hypothetical protein [Rahnella]UJD90265.1 hypothetical protein FS594_16590 [Rahnella aquatilis]MBU9828140.1 hypothetical protein [Rahnella perminowiae]MBU9837581.1 hypothetical protein [Rahnella perminowiae]MCR9000621.1 hypothetical protein [Rahnella perminowiae]MCX2944535.1 hypothetical protein [Rahnella perminowiae]